ncbi:MAG: peptidase M64 [Holophaga sp.]|nr:peptidase M64 [Holophaga sp.]
MNPLRLFPTLFLATCLTAAPPRTLRVDYVHTGTASSELFSLDRTVQEPLPWPGHSSGNLDTSNLGKYFFDVVDVASGQVVYSRGFCSIYGEWESTDEAKKMARSFSESLRFPEPNGPVKVRVKKRDAHNHFQEVWSFALDPKDIFIDRALPPNPGSLLALQKSGDPTEKVDFLILGDGYTQAELPKFEKDARRLMEQLFATSPYKEHRQDFNVWGLCPPARESGIARPSTGIQRRSPLGCTYDAFGSERYVLTFENRTLRDVAAFAPYEFMEILVNGDTYGGGGIFGLYGTVASDNAFSPYIFVHEFGHHFAGLADEYYTSDVAYETGKDQRPEPWEPNATANPNNPKWKALLTPGIPLPTPWAKAEFEKASWAFQKERGQIRAARRPEAEMEALMNRQKKVDSAFLGQDVWSGKVGAFEGANYEATGYFRAQEDCIMFTRDEVPFCAACQDAIRRVIRMYTPAR